MMRRQPLTGDEAACGWTAKAVCDQCGETCLWREGEIDPHLECADCATGGMYTALGRAADAARRTTALIPDVPTMARKWLVANGYDGLWTDSDGMACGCHVSDLFACGDVQRGCVAAHAVRDGTADDDDWLMFPGKREAADDPR